MMGSWGRSKNDERGLVEKGHFSRIPLVVDPARRLPEYSSDRPLRPLVPCDKLPS